MKGNRVILAAYVLLLLVLTFTLGYLMGAERGKTSITVTPVQAPVREKVIVPVYEVPLPTEDAPLDLNTATQLQLEALPGVGPALAERILAYREEIGPFLVVEQLMDVEGIGEKKFEAIRPLVTVSPP